jgi:hypothetical protein
MSWSLFVLVFLLVHPSTAGAQIYESAGTRAQGMGGAFVAVADDATATWWNPAGLATGAFFSAVVERGQTTEPSDPADDAAARRTSSGGFAAAFPALGVSFYKFRVSETTSASRPTDASVQTRQEDGAAGLGVQSRAVSRFGITVGQSLNDHIVVASTLKIMRGGGGEDVAADGDRLDAADDLEFARRTRLDVDAGVMAVFGGLRFGASARNLTRPDFGDDERPLVLDRQARAGVAFMSRPIGPVNGLTVSADADITKERSVLGEARRVAAGAEAWVLNRHLGLRGGVSHNTLDRHETAWSGGISVMLISGISVDAARTAGSDDSLRGWSGSVRLTF